ncbi:MAG TPA: LacI family DNA-binding transcriptional regulator [Niabella sp.]|nr:LacI family DNA-binding transcriptional regulator [Niabella sp.]
MKKKSSIHTIAKDLGVSATTISFIINGKARENRISDELITRVEKHLALIDYKPDVIAQSLRTGKSNLIGMLVENISDAFFSSIARGVELGFENSGYKILFMSTKNNSDNAALILNLLKEHKVDAFIIAPTPGLEGAIQELIGLGKPVVLYDRFFPGLPTCNVMIDNRGGAYMGAMELFNNNYHNVAFVTLKSAQVQMTDRLLGYRDALTQAGQRKNMVLEIPYNLNTPETALQIRNFFKKNNDIDGVFFATNYLVIAGLQAIKELGWTIAEDIGVVGFDDHTHFSLFSPSVTAVAQPVAEISKAIVQNLREALAGERGCEPRTVVLLPQLVRRESSSKRILVNMYK